MDIHFYFIEWTRLSDNYCFIQLPRTVYKLGPGDPENELNRAVVGFGNDEPIEIRENDGLCVSISTSGHDTRCCCC